MIGCPTMKKTIIAAAVLLDAVVLVHLAGSVVAALVFVVFVAAFLLPACALVLRLPHLRAMPPDLRLTAASVLVLVLVVPWFFVRKLFPFAPAFADVVACVILIGAAAKFGAVSATIEELGPALSRSRFVVSIVLPLLFALAWLGYGVPAGKDVLFHGLFGTYRGKLLGTFGCMATQSFHETKNINCGEGGALVINDPSLVERAEIIREKGTNRSRFFRGQVDKYTWVDIGSSYLPSDMLAAYLAGQLEKAEVIQAKRRRVWERYAAALPEWAKSHGVRMPVVPDHCEQPYHMFYLLFQCLDDRQEAMAWLRQHDIHAVFHYLPLNASMMGARFDAREGDCPVAEEVSDRLLRLPFYNGLQEHDQDRVIETLLSWRR